MHHSKIKIDAGAYQARVREDPEWYLRRILGADPWEKQVEIVQSVMGFRRTAVPGCVSSSKTMAAAMATFAFLSAFYPAKVITLAPTFRQVKYNLWGEIHSLYNHADRNAVPQGGRLIDTELVMAKDWYALGMSTNEPDRVHGIHGKNVLIIVDEGQGIKQPIWDGIENAMAGVGVRLLVLYNPTNLAGETYEMTHANAALFNTIRIPAHETPNFKAGRVVIQGMLAPSSAAEWAKKYGPKSNFVRVKVHALEPLQEADTLISLEWIEAAFVREASDDGDAHTGVDVARYGDDNSSIFTLKGLQGQPIKTVHGKNTMEVCGLMLRAMDAHGSDSTVDEIGIGSGVIDRAQEIADNAKKGSLEKNRKPVVGLNVSRKPLNPREFADRRSEVWWNIREALNPKNPNAISLVKDLRLQAQLSSVKYKVLSDKRIKVESKEEMKKRTGESPDEADAVGCALVGRGSGTSIPAGTADSHGTSGKAVGFDRLSHRSGLRRRRA